VWLGEEKNSKEPPENKLALKHSRDVQRITVKRITQHMILQTKHVIALLFWTPATARHTPASPCTPVTFKLRNFKTKSILLDHIFSSATCTATLYMLIRMLKHYFDSNSFLICLKQHPTTPTRTFTYFHKHFECYYYQVPLLRTLYVKIAITSYNIISLYVPTTVARTKPYRMLRNVAKDVTYTALKNSCLGASRCFTIFDVL
jgi:hypothetical protein